MSLSQYLLEFSICLALFYSFYHVVLRRETFFQLNRWYLLLTPAMCMIIPFLNWELPAESSTNNWDQLIIPLVSDIQQQQEVIWSHLETGPDPGWRLTYLDLLLVVYLLGLLWMAFRLFYRTWRLMRMIGRSKKENRTGYTVVRPDEKIPAASFLSYIFWQEGPLSPEKQRILEHELVHVRQWHSLDVLLMEIWVMLKWFHPFIYWYRNSLRLSHEYIADAYVSRTQGSRLEYARLLAGSDPVRPANRLLHHFHSSIKMRLIMLARKRSRNWKYLKYLMIIPVTSVLLLLFSFNLVDELPETLVDPLTRVERSFHDLASQPVLPETVATPEVAPKKSYSLKWGDIECDCQSEQFPNYYHCENQSLLPRELRRLIRKEGGFDLFLEDSPQAIHELKAISKHMKDMGGYQGQFDEMDRTFNTDSPLWKQAEKGDVFLFSFNNGQGDYFEFEVVINNRREDHIYGSRVEMGDHHFNINLTNDVGVIHLDVEELQDWARSPFKVRKNQDEYYQLSSLEITNNLALRQERWDNINSDQLDLSRSKPILEAYPGERVHVSFEVENGQEIKFDFLLRNNSAWDGRKRDHEIYWGDRTFHPLQTVLLTRKELESMLDEKMYLFANGSKHPMKDKKFEMHSFTMVDDKLLNKKISATGIKEFIKKAFPDYEGGRQIYARDLQKIDGYMTPPLKIMIDYDWKEVFADRAGVSVSEKENVLTIPNAQPEDLQRILDLDRFFAFFYRFQLDGKEYMGYKFPENELRKLIQQGLPRKQLVIGRMNCMECEMRKRN